MTAKALDDSWRAWVKENIARRCDADELVRILLRHEFSIESIREAMGEHFPAASATRNQPFVPRQLDDSWRGWLKENLQRQCNPEELVQILLQHDFSLETIRQAMEDKFPGASPLVNVLLRQEPLAKAEAISRPPLTRKALPGLRRVETDKLQLYQLDDFLTLAECDGLIDLIDRHLRPSTITFGDQYFRTSRTCDLSLISSPLVASVDEKIARTIGIRRAYSEVNQGQRYEVGQEFKPHTDFFEPGTDEYRHHAAARGNRTWTFMVYLNEGMDGGGTKFAAIDRTFYPRRGQALIWNNLRPDGTPNPATLHSGMPVTRGYKVIITQWFRERGEGPMFYDG